MGRDSSKDIMSPSTLFEKVWRAHVVEDLGDNTDLLYIDRHLLHDLSGPSAFVALRRRGLPCHDPSLSFAMADHLISTSVDRSNISSGFALSMRDALSESARSSGSRYFDEKSGRQGIVHVVGPELGIVLPGITVVCGDSHTSTNGALGAVAFGIGSTEILQALAAQVLIQRRPQQMRVTVRGVLSEGVYAKDLALFLIATLGAAAGTGYAIEFAGPVIDDFDIESRLTLCNLSVELGARFGIIAPDQKTNDWIRGRPFAPVGSSLELAESQWSRLRSDEFAVFDREEITDASVVDPMITWGTSPEHAVAISGTVPEVDFEHSTAKSESWGSAMEYMGLKPGQSIANEPVDYVFLGSCANSRLSDLRVAARIADGKKVAKGVTAWVVPGSESVRSAAEQEGLDEIFLAAGFEWRMPGCSMCVAANGDVVPPGARCVSTSNRNFRGRQGPGARTHLASPASAVASAITGVITDPRTMS
jgi:3-isopropylmalate/(R)-2-methylmalate dehydratase large subunit